ncbi:MAG: hypothetical protein K6E47_14330 [Lachnospiraceae bacterium]|nr:hypothetical protein [Lachnospiraceae bacterium]
MLKKMIYVMKKEFKVEQQGSTKENQEDLVLRIGKGTIKSIRDDDATMISPQDNAMMVETYWALDEDARDKVGRMMSRPIYGLLAELYSASLKDNKSVKYKLDKACELRRLFDPKHLFLEEIVFSYEPIFERTVFKNGFLVYPKGVTLLNPEDASKCTNACAVFYNYNKGFKGVEHPEVTRRFLYLTDNEDILETEDKERINDLCIAAWPEFKIILDASQKVSKRDKKDNEVTDVTVGYYMVHVHGANKAPVIMSNPDFTFYQACTSNYYNTKFGKSHLYVEEAIEGTMVFRVNIQE